MLLAPQVELQCNAARKRVAKTVKELCLEEREDFVKIRGSFYAGANSPVGRSLARRAEEKRLELERLEGGWLRCAWCDAWNRSA